MAAMVKPGDLLVVETLGIGAFQEGLWDLMAFSPNQTAEVS